MCASAEPYLHSIFLWPWSCHSSSSKVSFWVRIAIPALQRYCHNVSKQLNTMLGSLDLFNQFSSVQSLSHVQFWDPMDCSTPGLPVHLQLLEFTQNPCPLSQWWHPTISSSVIPFSSHLQSFPASGSFLVSQFFTSGGWSIGVSASALVLPMSIQDWFPLG